MDLECLFYQFINVLLTPDMKSVHLSLFLLLVASSREFGIQASKQEHKFTNSAVDANKFDRREGVFEGKESSVVQDASVILFREDGDQKEGLRETEDYLKFNGRSLDESNYNEGSNSNSEDMFSNSYSSNDKYTMVEKSLEESSQSSVNSGRNLPSIETVQGWASSAYSQLPSRQTVASYIPERVQQYLPSQQTIESYMPPIESVRTQLLIPLDYFKRKLFGGYKPQKLLTTEERDRLVQALSNKLLNKEGEDNIKDLMNEVAQNVAHRAEDNMTPIVIRLVVHRVVHAMAVSYIGPIGVFLARKQIDSLADAVADYAVAQYVKAGPSRIDLYSYLRQINWKAVYGNIVKIINTYYTSNTQEQ